MVAFGFAKEAYEEALNNLKEAIELYLEDEDAHVPLEGST
jgi:predicted RNase H-like HicB family nuclease